VIKLARKNNVNNIELEITDIDFWSPHEHERNEGGMRIYWSSTIGDGTYDLVKRENSWCAMSETMDSNDDKEFIEKLLQLFVKKLNIVE
jgi:hypothetical protein